MKKVVLPDIPIGSSLQPLKVRQLRAKVKDFDRVKSLQFDSFPTNLIGIHVNKLS